MIPADIQQALSNVGHQIEERLKDAKAGWQDSNSQHAITQLSLMEIRREMKDGLDRIDRRIDEVLTAIRNKK